MKIQLIILTLLFPAICYGQKNASLSEQLWSSVKFCSDMFEDNDEDGNPDFEKIDDSKNGYLKIFGIIPPCGCACSATVGAYKNNDGKYTFLQSDSESCSWHKKVSSNRNLKEILPDGFGIKSFLSGQSAAQPIAPVFFLNFNIPQVGTDTKVKLELVPFGLKPAGNELICYEYQQLENNAQSLRVIQTIAEEIKNEKTLDFILKDEFDKISEEDNVIIQKAISNGDLSSIEFLQQYLTEMKLIYDLYQKLDCTEITLGWSREKSSFYIKEKSGKPEKVSFTAFLIKNAFWSYVC